MGTHIHVSLSFQLSKKFPDFKRKDKTAALWIDSAPGWALANIERIEFDVPAKENKGWSNNFFCGHISVTFSPKCCIQMPCDKGPDRLIRWHLYWMSSNCYCCAHKKNNKEMPFD